MIILNLLISKIPINSSSYMMLATIYRYIMTTKNKKFLQVSFTQINDPIS